MILVTGGLGFVGSHTTRALLDLGESCVVVQRRAPALPDDLAGQQLFAERADVGDLAALLDLGRRYPITGIVHLAGSVPWPPGAQPPVAGARAAIGSLLNVLQAACEWQVPRVGIASTIGVYGGIDLNTVPGPLREDVPLPMTAGHVIPAFKKIGELLGDYLAGPTGIEIIDYRISPWGPGGNPTSPFTAGPQLIHAAARGTVPDFSALRAPAYAGDGFDMCYVKDCARAVALLQLAPRLNHRTYNIASGTALTNGEVAAALRGLVPDARIELPEGRAPGSGPALCLDITRLRQDTGYQPAYDTERAVADYVAWLRAGHDR